jgi:hypothetical protein
MPNETGAEILARIKPKLDEDWTEVNLRPDLQAELEEIESELDEVGNKPAGPGRLGDGGVSDEAVALSERAQAIVDQMAESAVIFRFRALPRDEFRALCDNHPPRKDDLADLSVGYDRVAVGDALVEASLYEPVFDSEAWRSLLGVISIGEWNELRRRAEKVNGSVVTESPKSLLASTILSLRARGSKQQPDSE